ncbi:MAG: VCBS repeat-containing protein, partial [Pyrinomonadaceae bacterium]
NNAADYMFVDPAGTSAGMSPHLGAPGPQNLSSPVFVNGTFEALRLDATKAVSLSPNRVRDFTSDPGNNSTFGTLSIRRRFVNNAAVESQMIRWRFIDTSTLPAAGGDADLRVRSVGIATVGSVNDSATCAATGSPATPPCTVVVQGTTLETPPAQPIGGGFNSSLLAGTVTLATPLAPGASLDLQFLMGVQQNGNYHMTLGLEALPRGGVVFTVTGNTNVPAANSDALNTVADFDGDGKSDLSVFRPATSVWYELRSKGGFLGVQFGAAGDRIVPADYDGDSKTDIAVYRPSSGVWYVINSSNNTFSYFNFGIAEDLPAPADHDGDGRADLCVFRPSRGVFYLRNSINGLISAVQFGANGDKPTVGDFDGDGKADIALFRPSAGSWYRLNSSNGAFVPTQFGVSTDLTVPADYDGDGKSDIAVYRASIGYWYRLNSSNGAFIATNFGLANDIPVPADFDGDGKADVSVFRPSDAAWYRLNSTNGSFFAQQFGANGDRPTPAAFSY